MNEQDEHIKTLMRAALDKAFGQQIIHLYGIWCQSGDLDAQRSRTAIGAGNAIEVYRIAISAVDSWDGTV